MQILIATTNKGKFQEMLEVLDDLNHQFLSLQDVDLDNIDVEETGSTYEENAIIKARHYAKLANLPTIGEDSGIIIEALKNELGVHTRRWGAGKDATDEEWINYFLNRMESFPETRGAKFISTAAFIKKYDQDLPQVFGGSTSGLITSQLMAPIVQGIPLSSCFQPDGHKKVYSQLTPTEKNQISHRGKAMHQLKNYLASLV